MFHANLTCIIQCSMNIVTDNGLGITIITKLPVVIKHALPKQKIVLWHDMPCTVIRPYR